MRNNKIWIKIFATLMVVVFFIGTMGTKTIAKESNVGYTDEDVELLAKSLELIYETGQVTEGNKILGFNKEKFEEELKENENYKEIISGLEEEGLFAEVTKPTISTFAVACDWYLMKEKPAYTAAQNKCIADGLKANYGPITVTSSIANLIFDKEFTLAAKKILELGIKSNLAGVIVTLSIILVSCNIEMEEKFPGKSNCE